MNRDRYDHREGQYGDDAPPRGPPRWTEREPQGARDNVRYQAQGGDNHRDDRDRGVNRGYDARDRPPARNDGPSYYSSSDRGFGDDRGPVGHGGNDYRGHRGDAHRDDQRDDRRNDRGMSLYNGAPRDDSRGGYKGDMRDDRRDDSRGGYKGDMRDDRRDDSRGGYKGAMRDDRRDDRGFKGGKGAKNSKDMPTLIPLYGTRCRYPYIRNWVAHAANSAGLAPDVMPLLMGIKKLAQLARVFEDFYLLLGDDVENSNTIGLEHHRHTEAMLDVLVNHLYCECGTPATRRRGMQYYCSEKCERK